MKLKLVEHKEQAGYFYVYDEQSAMSLCGQVGEYGSGGYWLHDIKKAKLFKDLSSAQNAKDFQEKQLAELKKNF